MQVEMLSIFIDETLFSLPVEGNICPLEAVP